MLLNLKNLVFACFLTSSVFSQEQPVSKRMDSLFQMISAYQLLNGAARVTSGNHTIYSASFGYADFAQNKPNSEMTGFALGSVSKIFTATAVLQLRDKGRFKLDDRFAAYIPAFPYTTITIRHLLSHTSGLPDYGIFETAIAQHPEKIFSNTDIIPLLSSRYPALAFIPGENWQYSNVNFCLLALLVEKISGVSFEQYVTEKILKPAEMSATCFDTGHRPRPAGLAINHDYPLLTDTMPVHADSIKKTKWRTYNLSGLLGQGNMYSTTSDMIRFDHALYGSRLLKQESLEELFTITKLSTGAGAVAESALGPAGYGLGWFVLQDTTSGKIVFHTGGVPGAVCIFVRNLSRRQSFVLFGNVFDPNVFAIGRNILKIMDHRAGIPLKKSLTRAYVRALMGNGLDAAFIKLVMLRLDSLHYFLSEDEMNELGLQLLYAGTTANHVSEALEVLKLNTLLFPQSFNTYDSYGEALAFAGKKPEAAAMYQRSIELNPQNKGGLEALERLRR